MAGTRLMSVLHKGKGISTILGFLWYVLWSACFWFLSSVFLTSLIIGFVVIEKGAFLSALNVASNYSLVATIMPFIIGGVLLYIRARYLSYDARASSQHKILIGVRLPATALFIWIVLYVCLIFAIGAKTLEARSAAKRIHSDRVTLDDVMGKNLPPQPDPTLASSTVEGVDANYNGIRDDVELAIFKMYPNSARIRAVELQYAKALQDELTQVSSIETGDAAIQEEGRASQCAFDLASNTGLTYIEINKMSETLKNEPTNLVFNTAVRKSTLNDLREYVTEFSVPPGEVCDIDLSTLPN